MEVVGADDLERDDEVATSGVLDITGAQLDEALKPELLRVLGDEKLREKVHTFDATTNRLRRVPTDVLSLPHLERMLLRKNLLPDMHFVGELQAAATLMELVVYDNAIASLPDPGALAALEKLELLDVSYNSLRNMRGIERVGGGRQSSRLRELYLAANKARSVSPNPNHDILPSAYISLSLMLANWPAVELRNICQCLCRVICRRNVANADEVQTCARVHVCVCVHVHVCMLPSMEFF